MNNKILLAAAPLLFLAAVWGAGSYLSKPVNKIIKMPKEFEPVVFNNTHGSFLDAGSNKVCALLMHGVRSNRTSMISRSYWLREIGISSLLIDLQAHGETLGEEITFGIRESIDAENGTSFLRSIKRCEKIVAIGQSLGGAAALLGKVPIQVEAFVLESVYPTIEEAVQDRLEMRLGKSGRLLAPLLYLQIPLRTGSSLFELRPIDALKRVNVPVFIISGAEDEHTKPDETKRMFNAINGSKELWLIDGAVHEDLLSYNPTEYKKKVASFIDGAVGGLDGK